jgi:hypothetical protein
VAQPQHSAVGYVVATAVEPDRQTVSPAGKSLSAVVRLYFWVMDTSLSHWGRMRVAHRSARVFHLRDRNSGRDRCKCDCNWGSVSSVRLGSLRLLGKLSCSFQRDIPKKKNMKGQKLTGLA